MIKLCQLQSESGIGVLEARKVKNIKTKKRLTTFALVIALMTGSVAELAVLLYRGAHMIVASSVRFAAT